MRLVVDLARETESFVSQHALEFCLSVLASLVAAWVIAWLRPAWRTELEQLHEYLGQRRRRLGRMRRPIDPKAQIRYVFQMIRAIDRTLDYLQYSREKLEASDAVVITGWYSLLAIDILASVIGALPPSSAALVFLTLSGLFACIAGLLRPRNFAVFLVAFPVSWLILPFTLRTHRLATTRLDRIETARWHLLFAMPSTNSARRTVERKSEHVQHFTQAMEALESLRDDPEIGEAIVGLQARTADTLAVMKSWPSTCDPFLTAGIRQLEQVTTSELRADSSRGF